MWARAIAIVVVVATMFVATFAHAQADEAKKKDAQAHFEQGLQLATEEVWDAALAEYLLSRKLYPTKAATKNAALCLRKLRRWDEALAMLQSLLLDFPSLSDQDRSFAAKEMKEVEPHVGT